MVNKTISIDYSLNEKLKLEENASQLISNLLNDYYNSEIKNKVPIEIKEQKLQEFKKEIIEQEREIEELKKQEVIKEKTDEEKAELKRRNDEASEKLRNEILESMK